MKIFYTCIVIIIIYIFYKIYENKHITEQFKSKLQSGRSANMFHPVNIRGRYRKLIRNKKYREYINRTRNNINRTLWSFIGIKNLL